MKLLYTLLLTSSFLIGEETEELHLTSAPSFTAPSLPAIPESPKAPLLAKPHRNSFFATTLAFIPGLGHVFLGDLKTAGTLFGSATLSSGLENNKNTNAYSQLFSSQNITFYSVYAAYRDVRINNEQRGYRYTMPTDSFQDLTFAPFRWSVLKKPEVWGGLLGSLAAASAVSYFLFEPDSHIACSTKNSTILPFAAFSIGLGEEAFFRGYLQSFLAERMSPAAAITTSSLVFGAAHIGNILTVENDQVVLVENWREYLTYGIPFISTLGGYMGWLTHKNRSLQQSVALHAWYDFAIFLSQAVATPTAMAGSPRFAYSISF
jgi:membrane protease YdiL (CAAX protease family)